MRPPSLNEAHALARALWCAPPRCAAAPSRVRGAGRGVFALRAARAGDALTLYPGVYHPPSRLEALPGVWLAWVAADPGASARPSAYALRLRRATGRLVADGGGPGAPRGGETDGRALGHLVNHPPAGAAPTVCLADFLWRGPPPAGGWLTRLSLIHI